jgi:excinuclease ABC subunit C
MNISHIPNASWVYFFKDKLWKILYIGKAKNLQKRLGQYFSPWSVRKQEMLAKANTVDFVIVQNESEALYLEDNLIKTHKPEYNNMLKGSNSYAYIKITKEKFPQIYITRKKINDWAIYIGPKHNTMHLKKFFQYLRQVLQYRGCKSTEFKKWKLCSDYYFWLCKGRCNKQTILSKLWEKNKTFTKKIWPSLSPTVLYEDEILHNYKSIINYIISFFRWDTQPIEKEILKQIEGAITLQNFERAAKLRDIYQNIQNLSEYQTVVISKTITGYLFRIKKIWKRLVYVLLYFHQWKLIDIIRHKFHQDESDMVSIISSISNECGEFTCTPDIITPQTNNVFWVNNTLKKLSKSDTQKLQQLIEGFFDSYIISTSFEWENLNNELLSQLQSRYHLKNFPYHIECMDISHLSWSWTSGWLSCFLGWLAEKKYYRKYKIQSDPLSKKWSKNSDDYASLKQLILRRFQNKQFVPNLLILDGWKGQLKIIDKLYHEQKHFQEIFDQIDIISLWKWEARKKTKIGQKSKSKKIGEKIYYFESDFSIKSKNLIYDQADKILINIRDEAHRFSNVYRKNQMSAQRKK